jgi:hypothetical protein
MYTFGKAVCDSGTALEPKELEGICKKLFAAQYEVILQLASAEI